MPRAELRHSSAVDLDENEPSLEIAGLLHALLRRSWVIALGAIVAVLVAGSYVQRIPDRYQSKTVIQIESQAATKPIKSDDADADSLRDPVVMETVIQNFRNRSLMERVARELKLVDDPDFLGRSNLLPASEAEVVKILSSSATVVPRPKTLLVDISFTHSNPKVAQKLTTTIVDQFLAENTTQQIKQMDGQNALLVQKAAELKIKLETSEQAVQAYKNRMESVSLDAGRNLVESKLQGLNSSLSGARNERLRIESDLNLLRAVSDREPSRLLGIASVSADPQVVEAQTRVKALEAEIQALADQYRNKHPRMVESRNRLDEARMVERETVQSAPDRVAARYAGASAAEQTLEKAVSEQEKLLLKLDEKITPYRALQQELEADRTLYDGVQKRLKETMILMDVKPVNFRVVEPAVPAYLLPDRRLAILIGGTVGGALLAAAFLAALFFFDSSIKTVDDAERWLGLPVLAAIPTLPKVQSSVRSIALVNHPASPAAESFRSLRTALSLLGPAAQRKVILFTSAVPAEGKTLTALNAAIAFAQQGLRTVILDADLRRPVLSGLLLNSTDKIAGISEYLIGEMPQFRQTEIPNLFIFPVGGRAPNPAELLAGDRFEELIEAMKTQFDRIVIDTAPVNVVSDTLNFVALAETVVLVVRNGSTPRKVIRRALYLLGRAHVRPDGLALTCMPDWSGVGAHYHYSSSVKYGGAETYDGSYYRPVEENREAKPQTDVVSKKIRASSENET